MAPKPWADALVAMGAAATSESRAARAGWWEVVALDLFGKWNGQIGGIEGRSLRALIRAKSDSVPNQKPNGVFRLAQEPRTFARTRRLPQRSR